MNTKQPQVGVGLLLVKDGKIILGQRKNAHGDGEYGGAGGHLEPQETFEEGILREVAEELGPDVKLKNLRLHCITNLRRYAPKHYVDIGMIAEWVSGEPRVMEPDKIVSWEWFDIDNLPDNLFACTQNYVQAYKTGKFYFTT
jgi:8-oxo-dGTP diphosphatase